MTDPRRNRYTSHTRRLVTDAEARAIIQSPKTNAELAREYGYDKSTISRIRSGK